jgi:hypothetical protein
MHSGGETTSAKGFSAWEKGRRKRRKMRKETPKKTGARTSLGDQKKYLDPHLCYFFFSAGV